MTTGPVTGRYFDGRASLPRRVRIEVAGGDLRLSGAGIERVDPLAEVEISERLEAAPRLVLYRDGARLELDNQPALDAMFAAAGVRDAAAARWAASTAWALGAVALTVLLLLAAWRWGIPAAAQVAAEVVPPSVETAIGERAAALVDQRLMSPSRLPAARREALAARFGELLAASPGPAPVVEFRASEIGANALALPGGRVIVTDELVELMPGDAEIVAVMAHELGHVQRRHFMRQLIASTLVGAAVTLIAGDASSVLVALPATLAELAYSRDMEREADAFAVDLLRARGQDPAALATALEALAAAAGEAPARAGSTAGGAGEAESPAGAQEPESGRIGRGLPAYVSTHPDTAERVRAIRAAAAAGRPLSP